MRAFVSLLAAAGVIAICPDAAAQKAVPPLPFAYVGKLVQGGERYAVVARGESVLLVRAGDPIGSGYRVQSVTEQQLLVMNLASGVVQTLAFSSSPTSPQAGADAPLRLAGPSEVPMGEQFTLTVSLDTGTSVELRFDPKVLQLRGSEAEGAVGGSARVEVSGATAVQFRVVARAPTATEIRVVADDGPAAHRVAIVPRR